MIFKSVAIANIAVPEDRARLVDEDHALAINASIVEHGLLSPILVRATPRAARPYTLVAGAHRLRAMVQLEETEIDCLVFKGDKVQAVLAEVTENIFRNELSVLDRAVSIQIYRDAWEDKHGAIKRGNPDLSNSVNLMELVEDEASKGFSQQCADRLGFSVPKVERLTRIAKTITGELRQTIRTLYPALADNQSVLLKFCDLDPSQHKALITALGETDGDAQAALDLLVDKPKPLPLSERRYQASLSAFARLNLAQKRRAVAELTALLEAEEARQAKREATRKTNDAAPGKGASS